MERIPTFLRERGFRVFVAQEAATMMFLNGGSVDDFGTPGCLDAFQQFVSTVVGILVLNHKFSLGYKNSNNVGRLFNKLCPVYKGPQCDTL
jgi:hypothetical protein